MMEMAKETYLFNVVVVEAEDPEKPWDVYTRAF